MISANAIGQTVDLNYTDEVLNEILIDFNKKYDVEISINSSLSSGCKISIDRSFKSVDEAVHALADLCSLELLLINNVYTFRSRSEQNSVSRPAKKNNPNFLYQGKVVDGSSGEPLPYASITTDAIGLITDDEGRFSFKAHEENARVQFQYLGYHQADTLIAHENKLEIKLQRGSIDLMEVVVSAASTVILATTGDQNGHVQLNDAATTLIPGNNTNMIFNHLRLYPGIMAAGESTSDFIIWGSYAGQNQMIYDGITLFNSYGINDDIGRVNPLMIKNIEVHKGGYNVDVGDRIGGVILVDGKSGNRNNVDGKISISNEMANAYLSIPLFKRSSTLQIAGRKSYYQWLNWNSIIDKRSDDFVIPEYDYGDGNLKFTTEFKNNDRLEISGMVSRDMYSESLIRDGNIRYVRNLDVSSLQVGSSAKYSRIWNKGGITSLKFSQSYYDSDLNANITFSRDFAPAEDRDYSDNWKNNISEYSSEVKHQFVAKRRQDIQLSVRHVRNQYEFDSKSSSTFTDVIEHVDRLSVYFKDDISVAQKFSLRLGLKTDIPFSDFMPYFQPRINAKIDMTQRWKMNFGWGMYNQFVSKTPLIDMDGNRLIVWQTADGENIPVLSSMHHVLGVSYLSTKLEMSVEGYYKKTNGLSRFIENRDNHTGIYREGEARSYGMDAFLKTRFCHHEFWVSYSLARVEEKFSQVVGYRDAPHSQSHEVKTALILNFLPVQISITNIYGTGFLNNTIESDGLERTPYNRLDLAFQYGVDIKKTRLETGFSILNLLNQENIRLNQFVRFPDGTNSSTSAIPFTPSLYLNFGF